LSKGALTAAEMMVTGFNINDLLIDDEELPSKPSSVVPPVEKSATFQQLSSTSMDLLGLESLPPPKADIRESGQEVPPPQSQTGSGSGVAPPPGGKKGLRNIQVCPRQIYEQGENYIIFLFTGILGATAVQEMMIGGLHLEQ
jgi:hypothetical protein